MSSAEAELRSLTRGSCDAVFIQQILREWGLGSRTVAWCDASAALAASKKLSGTKLKHLRGCESFIRALVKQRIIHPRKIDTKENLADALTKHITVETARRLIPRMGWRPLVPSEINASVVKMTRSNQINSLEATDGIVQAHEARCHERAVNTGATMGKWNQQSEDWNRFLQCWQDLNRPRPAQPVGDENGEGAERQ